MLLEWDALPELIDAYDRRFRLLEKEAIAAIDLRIDNALQVLERAFIPTYTALLLNPSLTPSQKRAVLMDQLRQQSQLINPAMEADYLDLFEQLIETNTQGGAQLGRELTGHSAPVISTVAIAALAAEAVRRLYSHNARFQSKLSALAEFGFSRRQGARAMLTEIRKGAGELKTRARAIVETEASGALNGGAIATYQAAGVALVMFYTVGDDKVCGYCSPRQGLVYQLGEIATPLHVFCRCLLLPLLEVDLRDPRFQKWSRAASLAAMKELRNAGKRVANSVAPFERAAGRDRPPKPTWSPR
ncbi:minor capsid protein [Leptolyngbya sp. FACHB-16]|uniref:minor capsid protein n=1 Tax=unclassified Leptolyngbya TaxID=2650499 RepID=UPI001684F6DE|nr:minor capsid protein [Leptolyngbya sp. FACHB-16]MBD2156224.1 minor capsid protein [Leptolyngbya sp. FACHB-16]